jgi:nitrogenase subunit NifH
MKLEYKFLSTMDIMSKEVNDRYFSSLDEHRYPYTHNNITISISGLTGNGKSMIAGNIVDMLSNFKVKSVLIVEYETVTKIVFEKIPFNKKLYRKTISEKMFEKEKEKRLSKLYDELTKSSMENKNAKENR